MNRVLEDDLQANANRKRILGGLVIIVNGM